MRPPAVPVYYWDSNMFIAYLKKEEGRWELIEYYLDRAVKGDCEIWTSTLSIAEVVKDDTPVGQPLTEEVIERIDRFWSYPSPVRLFDVSELIVRDAREVVRLVHSHERRGLRSADAIHIATARRTLANRGSVELNTYDTQLLKLNGEFSFKIKEPDKAFDLF